MSSNNSLPIITVTHTEFYKLAFQTRKGISIDCESRWHEVSCPHCTRLFRIHETTEKFECIYCGYATSRYAWRPDRIGKDGPTLRPVGWKLAEITEN